MSYQPKSIFATLPFAQRGTAMVLNGDPKGKNFLYCNGNTVVIRDIANPGIADTYTQHSVQATVAQYAPSGFYIASGDVAGKIRIWDTVNKEHILKYEYQPFAGTIKDIAWSPDSKRIAVCGQGREIFGAVFLWDSGSSVGSISGHSKTINSISFKQTRPFRVATASEDFSVRFYEGPPFKFKSSVKDHTNFVNCVRFSPDGELFCTGSSDGHALLCNGRSGEKVGALGEPNKAHGGGVYAVSWSPDGTQILTASGDKSCKLWDVETRHVVSEFKMGNNWQDQQVGCLWQGDYLLSVSVCGFINYLDKNDPSKPIRILTGQNKNLSSIAVSADSSTIYCGSMDGRVTHWGVESGEVDLVSGPGHTNLVCSMVATPDVLYTLGVDKSLKTVSTANNEFNVNSFTASDRDPTSLAVSNDGLAVITTLNELLLVRDNQKVGSLSIGYEATSASFHPSLPQLVVGGKDGKARIFSVDGDSFKEMTEIDYTKEVSAVAYSPSGNFLAVSGGNRHVLVYETSAYKEVKDFLRHTGRVSCLAWSPNSKQLVSGGIDTNIAVYNMDSEESEFIRGAHPLSIITGVAWINDSSFASCGHDCCIRVWQQS